MSASTTQSTTRIGKGREGWEAKTTIGLGVANRILQISTHKGSRGLVTCSSVMKSENGILTFEMFGDFSKRVPYNGVRCTEKTVRELHAQALSVSDLTMAEAAAFYVAKDAKDAEAGKREAAYVAAQAVHGAIDPNEAHNNPMDDCNYVGHPMHY